MPSLHSTLSRLMDDFVSAVVGALRASSVQDLLGTFSDGCGSSPARQSTAESIT